MKKIYLFKSLSVKYILLLFILVNNRKDIKPLYCFQHNNIFHRNTQFYCRGLVTIKTERTSESTTSGIDDTRDNAIKIKADTKNICYDRSKS
jgi:hypothetical protein